MLDCAILTENLIMLEAASKLHCHTLCKLKTQYLDGCTLKDDMTDQKLICEIREL